MTLGVNPENCTVFIQIWVDINALAVGATTGCYAVDNLQGTTTDGVTTEGGPNLVSAVPPNTSICWQVLPIDPTYAGTLAITEISTSSGWQNQPAQYSTADLWTGTVSPSSTTSDNLMQGIVINFDQGAQTWSGPLPMSVVFK